ncbi:MAG: LutC/YkgG family protein, partial [Solirubrobacteraceae bacterium]
ADPDPAAAYARSSPLQGGALVKRFAERVADYRAEVTRVTGEDQVAGAVAAVLERHASRRVVVPGDLPPAWVPAGLDVVAADAEPLVLDTVDGVLTACAVAIADTGTIVLDAGTGQGPRRATLVPDLHICVVPAWHVVGTVPEALDALAPAVREHGRPLTWIAGPSATSDIEFERVEGVHGPRRLEVVVVG